MTAILPGATIGILGGGQLGRMTAMAARSLGYRIQVMDPDPSCPARFVVDACFEGGWDDARVAADLARGCDVVTLEIEQVSIACLEAAAKYAPVRPGAGLMRVIQDRILQKTWLRGAWILRWGRGARRGRRRNWPRRLRRWGARCFVKSARGGYDGRSQVKIGFETQDESTAARGVAAAGREPAWRSRRSIWTARFR